jgi:hypothetical protein
MYEYGIYNTETKEQNIIFGYTFNDACRRAHLDPDLWDIDYQYYVD